MTVFQVCLAIAFLVATESCIFPFVRMTSSVPAQGDAAADSASTVAAAAGGNSSAAGGSNSSAASGGASAQAGATTQAMSAGGCPNPNALARIACSTCIASNPKPCPSTGQLCCPAVTKSCCYYPRTG